jgi:hypothetical protein
MVSINGWTHLRIAELIPTGKINSIKFQFGAQTAAY